MDKQYVASDEKNAQSVVLESQGDPEHEVGLDLYRQAKELEYTPEESKRVFVYYLVFVGTSCSRDSLRLRKIDWHILPMFMVTQGLAYLDKTAINYANLFGIRTSLHITQAQYVRLRRLAYFRLIQFPRHGSRRHSTSLISSLLGPPIFYCRNTPCVSCSFTETELIYQSDRESHGNHLFLLGNRLCRECSRPGRTTN